MKILIALTTTLAMTLASFTTISRHGSDNISTAEQLAGRIIFALQNESEAEYLKLFPTLEDFHSLMELNRDIYGNNLSEAKAEFATEYRDVIIPAVSKSFREFLEAGAARGIIWNEITFNGAEFRSEHKTGMTIPGIVSFNYRGEQFLVRIEKALIINNSWKTGQYLSFR